MVWEIKERRYRLGGTGPPLELGRNICEAAENGDTQRLEEILPHVPVDQLNQPNGVYGWSALSAAVHGDHAEAVKLLLASGANPNWQDGDGDSFPVNWASSANVASLLVEAGCLLHVRNRQGEIPADTARRYRPLPRLVGDIRGGLQCCRVTHVRASVLEALTLHVLRRKNHLAVAMVYDEGGRNPRTSWVPVAKPKPPLHTAKEGEES